MIESPPFNPPTLEKLLEKYPPKTEAINLGKGGDHEHELGPHEMTLSRNEKGIIVYIEPGSIKPVVEQKNA